MQKAQSRQDRPLPTAFRLLPSAFQPRPQSPPDPNALPVRHHRHDLRLASDRHGNSIR